MTTEDKLGLLTTLGRELSGALESSVPDASGQECYDALTEFCDRDIDLEYLSSFTANDYNQMAKVFFNYFEVSSISSGQLSHAITQTIKHWS